MIGEQKETGQNRKDDGHVQAFQLSGVLSYRQFGLVFERTSAGGFESPTFGFGSRHSVQLSCADSEGDSARPHLGFSLALHVLAVIGSMRMIDQETKSELVQ